MDASHVADKNIESPPCSFWKRICAGVLLFFSLFFCFPAQAAERWVDYSEHLIGGVRSFKATYDGTEWIVAQQKGDFQGKWFLEDGEPLQKIRVIQLDNLPELKLEQTFSPLKNVPNTYRVDFKLTLNEEVIPMNEEESKQNELLRQSGLRGISLKGAGRVMLNKSGSVVLAEEFVLEGDLTFQEHQKKLRIEYATAVGGEE